MLQQLRSAAAGVVVKALLLLLVISFAAWGVQGYIFQEQQGDSVAKVGESSISRAEVASAFRRQLTRYRSQGLDFSEEQARSFGVLDQVIQQLIAARVYESGGEWLGMGVSDAAVRDIVRGEEVFFDETGRFSLTRYQFVLNQIGVSESQFVAETRRDILRRQIINSFDYSGDAPAVLVKALHRLRGEKRTAEIVTVPVDKALDVGEPDSTALAEIHQARAELFTAPERRRLSFLHLGSEAVLGEIVVTEDQIRQEYDNSINSFTTPETRAVQQMLLDDEETATRAAKALAGGQDYETVAKEIAGQDAADLELGTFTAGSFPAPELWDAVAGLSSGGNSEPRQTDFGWHIFRVTEIAAESITPYVDVRADIESALKNEQVGEALYRLSTALEDELAGGAGLEEAAGTLGVLVQKAGPLDIGGNDESGAPATGLPGGDFLASAFATLNGEISNVVQLAEGYYILRVEDVVPSALRPLEDVRDEVAGLWKDEKRLEAARTRALSIVERIENGGSLSEIAAAEGLTVSETSPFDRRGQGENLPAVTPRLVSDLFDARPGQAAMDESPEGMVVARLTSIVPADPGETGELGTVLGDQMIGDLLDQFSMGLRARFGVEIDRAALNRL